MRDKSKLAGQTVTIKNGKLKGQQYHVEDWWENVGGESWMFATGNPACLGYAARTGFQDFRTPINNEVLYGKIGRLGELVHITEIN